MSDVNQLIKELKDIIADTGTPILGRATQITDDLSQQYADLVDANPTFSQINDMAGKIKASGATEGENGVMWGEVIRLVHTLADS